MKFFTNLLSRKNEAPAVIDIPPLQVTVPEVVKDEFNFEQFTFNDRLSYLAWRKSWAKEYLQVSKNIRDTKNSFKNEQRKITYESHTEYGGWIETKFADSNVYYKALNQLILYRSKAIRMLTALGVAKEVSAEQREIRIAELKKHK